MARLGVITGLQREVRCLAPFQRNVLVGCSGAHTGRAKDQARYLLARGCGALMSFGIAGGLDPDLEPGTVVIAETVVSHDGAHYRSDDLWRERVLAHLGGNRGLESPIARGAIAASDAVLSTAADKRKMYDRTGARAVDMETGAVAEVAEANDVPFLAVRVIADPAGGAVPVSASGAIAEDGSERIGAVLGGLMVRPWELRSVVALAQSNRRATGVLRRVALRLGPEFGLR